MFKTSRWSVVGRALLSALLVAGLSCTTADQPTVPAEDAAMLALASQAGAPQAGPADDSNGLIYLGVAAPAVVAITPGVAATAVAVASPIAITFNQAMLATSITASSVVLVNAYGMAVPAYVAYNPYTFVATLTPTVALSAYTSYSVLLRSSVMAMTGAYLTTGFTSYFTTGGFVALSPPPAVVSITPFVGATAVAVTAPIAVTFNTAIVASTITSSSIVLTNAYGMAIPCYVAYNPYTFVATLTPAVALSAYTNYFVTVRPTVVATTGVALSTAFNGWFTTGGFVWF